MGSKPGLDLPSFLSDIHQSPLNGTNSDSPMFQYCPFIVENGKGSRGQKKKKKGREREGGKVEIVYQDKNSKEQQCP